MTKSDTFRQEVYRIVSTIPRGKVLTYGDIARMLGRPNAARAVGYINSRNPDAPSVPCHRVVGSDGSLHGYANGGVMAKRALLLKEGVAMVGERVDLAMSRWDGRLAE